MLISAREEEVDSAADPDKEGIEVALDHCSEQALRAKTGVVEVIGVKIEEQYQGLIGDWRVGREREVVT